MSTTGHPIQSIVRPLGQKGCRSCNLQHRSLRAQSRPRPRSTPRKSRPVSSRYVPSSRLFLCVALNASGGRASTISYPASSGFGVEMRLSVGSSGAVVLCGSAGQVLQWGTFRAIGQSVPGRNRVALPDGAHPPSVRVNRRHLVRVQHPSLWARSRPARRRGISQVPVPVRRHLAAQGCLWKPSQDAAMRAVRSGVRRQHTPEAGRFHCSRIWRPLR